MQVVRGVDPSSAIDFSGKTVYHDFRDDLVKQGYAVIPAIDPHRAAQYADMFHSYLENL